MPDTLDTADAGAMDDLSALAWVHGELRRSLEAANKALRRYLRESEAAAGSDVDAVDPAVLRTVRSQLHQGVGALELVGLPAVADVLRASEAAVQRMVARPAMADHAAVETVERVSFALLDFLGRQLAGKPVSPLMLFPQYRAAQQLAGADRIHPADLWRIDWHWLELPPDAAAQARSADDQARGAMETLVLALMRDPSHSALARMSDLCADLAAGARQAAHTPPLLDSAALRLATFWQLAAAVFEAQASGLLVGDIYTKRIASRLLAQLRMEVRGRAELSDRLAQDLLFFCSHAQPPHAGHPAPRLAAVRQAWHLAELPTADYETPRLGRFDPALVSQARKRVAAAKDSWSAVAGGEMHRSTGLAEQFVLVGDSLQKLFPCGEVLAQALSTAVAQTVAAATEPPPALAMEIATGMLYLDASLEDGEFDHPELAARVQHLARRIDDVRIGAEPQPLEAWMEELYRRVSDRQTMGSVVQELRASLSEVEKQIDQYFRNPAQRELLIPVPAQFQAMRGVLSVLGLDQASHAVVHLSDAVDALAQTEVDPQRAIQAGTFDRLADNLGALSFLIDMLAVQPALAKSLFRFDPETGNLSAVMGQPERVSAFAELDETPAPVAAPQAPTLQEQAAALAAAAGRAEVGDDELAGHIERLAHQALAADEPELARLLGRAQSALLRAADAAARSAVRTELAVALSQRAPGLPELPAPAPVPPPSLVSPGSSGLEDNAEVREIFIEEAREVITDARAALERLADAPESASDMTTVRRAFHTLKGSARMVGLPAYGEAAWACEQLYNARLAQAPRMDKPLRLFSVEALDYLGAWVEATAEGRASGHNAAAVATAADALRLHGHRLGIEAPQLPATAVEVALATLRDLPSVAELPLSFERAAPAEPLVLPELEPRPEPAAAPADVGAPTEAAPLPVPAEPEVAIGPAIEFELVLDDEAAPPWEATIALQAPSPRVPAEPTEVLDFELDLAAETPAVFEATSALMQRVPDLPSAADLDLELPDLGPLLPEEAAAQTPPAATEPSFLLDLQTEGAAAADAAAAETTPAEFTAQALPAPEVEALEIDLGAMDLLFPGVTAAAPEPAAPADQPPLDVDRVAQAAEVAGEEAPTEVLPVGEVVIEEAAEAGEAAEAAEAASAGSEDEQVKVIGPLRIGIPLFNIYLGEADELSRRLGIELAEWSVEFDRHPVPESSVALAHSLAGSSATVGYADLSALARALEHALMRSHAAGSGRPGEPELFNETADEIRRLLHQFAAGFLRPVVPELIERLAMQERAPVPAPAMTAEPAALAAGSVAADAAADAAAEGAETGDEGVDIEAVDTLDPELFPIFAEEAEELLPQLQTRLRDWLAHPNALDAASACMRTLHTFKGGARLAGAMRLGEMAHRLESAVERLTAREAVAATEVEPLLNRADAMALAFDALRKGGDKAPPEPVPVSVPDSGQEPSPEPVVLPEPRQAAEPVAEPTAVPVPEPEVEPISEPISVPGFEPGSVPESVPISGPITAPAAEPVAAPASAPVAEAPVAGAVETAATARTIDWSRFASEPAVAATAAAERPTPGGTSGAAVRVRAVLLDRLVNQAGEVSIARARIDADVRQLHGWLAELSDSLDRMRRQLRDIELHAETQISSRLEATKAAAVSFDPLEMDRFTRFQELTRFMAESVNDVATLQRSLQRTLQSAEDQLAAQARLTRELQDDLLRTRMVEFESMSERLHRTVRQAARDTGKQVRLDIEGGAIEIDRGVLERMTGPFEHLLRNAVAHGIESPAQRRAAGKDGSGRITISVAQAGNEVAVEFADDGAGLDLQRIRQRGLERGLLAPDQPLSDAELAQLIFSPGVSTADSVTELAGRGVGLDVVRAEVVAMGGRVETLSSPGRGTRFKLLLPLTTAVTQVVMLRCGEQQVAVPSTLIEVVRRVPAAEAERAYAEGVIDYAGESLPFFWLAALLQAGTRGAIEGRAQAVVIVRSAAQRVAVHVDEVVGNQEVVVKNVGPQLSRLPGLAGVTLLPSGTVALIYNPVALAGVYAKQGRALMRAGVPTGALLQGEVLQATVAPAEPVQRAPLVMVVDDSLTVRRVTERLLLREGYRVVTAKDGLEALERLAGERPVVLLSDIEMPRMDGFDLVRNVRAAPRLADLPVIMITSRIAQKHRDYARELGVQHYLGKPYSEDELLLLVARHAGAAVPDILT